MQGLSFSSKLYLGTWSVSIAKTTFRKLYQLLYYVWCFHILRLTFVSRNLPLALHWIPFSFWAVTSNCYLNLLDKLQKQLYMYDCWSCTCCLLWTLGSWLNIGQAKSAKYVTLLDLHLNWFYWLHFLILLGDPLVTLISCMIFLSPFVCNIKMNVSIISLFP